MAGNSKIGTPKKRISNRRYPEKVCAKTSCTKKFIPTDKRQIYCCPQHRIDNNNDRRQILESSDIKFLRGVRRNRQILMKIYNSTNYKTAQKTSKAILDYEEFDFLYYHSKPIKTENNHEVIRCYDYYLECIDVQKGEFLITLNSKK